jgi:hypothetical protein
MKEVVVTGKVRGGFQEQETPEMAEIAFQESLARHLQERWLMAREKGDDESAQYAFEVYKDTKSKVSVAKHIFRRNENIARISKTVVLTGLAGSYLAEFGGDSLDVVHAPQDQVSGNAVAVVGMMRSIRSARRPA